jgi:hypothetical protein
VVKNDITEVVAVVEKVITKVVAVVVGEDITEVVAIVV